MIFSMDTGALVKLVKALTYGDTNIIEKLIEDKFEDLGKDFLKNLLPSLDPKVMRVGKAVETGGASEFARARNAWLSSITPSPVPSQGLFNRIASKFEQNKQLLSRPEGKWFKWSRSRQEWLDERFRHDWRTQPRDYHGRWKVGRLRSPYVAKYQRRLRTMRRKAARRMVQQIMKEMNRSGS